jgi:acetyl esterase/lipase
MYFQKSSLASILIVAITACGQTNQSSYITEYYESEEATLPMHIFQPEDLSRDISYPTILFFHGGAWKTGSPEQFHPQCRILSKLGIQCISIGYRVSTIHQSTPSQSANDALSAVRYLYNHANFFKINTQQVVLAGGSAGGHLAALSAIRLQKQFPELNIAALILLNPILNLAPGNPDHYLMATDWLQLSPFHLMQNPIPPTLILVGDQDKESPLSLLKSFCHKAKSLGSVCNINVSKGQSHGFFNYPVSRFQFYRTLYLMYQFLRITLGQ